MLAIRETNNSIPWNDIEPVRQYARRLSEQSLYVVFLYTMSDNNRFCQQPGYHKICASAVAALSELHYPGLLRGFVAIDFDQDRITNVESIDIAVQLQLIPWCVTRRAR
jgi:hypothetical protein